MRRFILPAVVLAVAIAATVLAAGANDAADPDDPADTTADALVTPLLSVRRTPEWLRQPTTASILDRSVRAPIDALGDTARTCATVLVNGEPVTAIESEVPLTPGSIQRLLTLAALETGDTSGFSTEVVRANDAVITPEGVLEGDLWLLGGADPVLSTEAFIGRFDDDRAHTSLEDLAEDTAKALAEAGITSIDGRVVGVDTKYGSTLQVFGDYWTAADRATGQVGTVAGLLVDNGLSSFPLDTVDATANVRSTDPVGDAARAFAEALTAAGVPSSGAAGAGDAPAALTREMVAGIESPPLAEIAKRAVIDGTTAEMLWREIVVRSGGSADNGFAILLSVNTALIELGVLPDEVAGNYDKVDGSGLSVQNKARCGSLAGVLDPDVSALASGALPPVEASPLASCAPSGLESLHVTADTRPDVTSMAGRAVASNGDEIAFAVIANWQPAGPEASVDACAGPLPAILDAIAQHPAGPDLESLTPRTASE